MNGRADFDDFVNFFCSSLSDISHDEEIDATFKKLDRDGDGVLSKEDLMASLATLDGYALEEEVRLIVSFRQANKSMPLRSLKFFESLEKGRGRSALRPSKKLF